MLLNLKLTWYSNYDAFITFYDLGYMVQAKKVSWI